MKQIMHRHATEHVENTNVRPLPKQTIVNTVPGLQDLLSSFKLSHPVQNMQLKYNVQNFCRILFSGFSVSTLMSRLMYDQN